VIASWLRRDEHGHGVWFARCDCGQPCEASTLALRKGTKRSCGCLRVETARINGLRAEKPIRHGHAKARTPEYAIWRSMRQRCLNPHSADYPSYGGRGITVCERWASFEAFFADMGSRPSSRHSLDRVNNEKGYEPGNCRWATWREQRLNQRRRFA
jgi:hypothetical protein